MAYTTSNRWNPEIVLKRARTLLAEYEAIVAEADAQLADPEDLRPIGGQLQRTRNEALGLPVDRTRFDRAAAARARAELGRMLEDAAQSVAVASRG